MIRKQIYLEKSQEKAINQLALQTGENASALIRRAIDTFVEQQTTASLDYKKHVQQVISEVAGTWSNHDAMDFETLRASGNRKFKDWNS